jgi:hypothetical protein
MGKKLGTCYFTKLAVNWRENSFIEEGGFWNAWTTGKLNWKLLP